MLSDHFNSFDHEVTIDQLMDRDAGKWNVDPINSVFLPFEARQILQCPLGLWKKPTGKQSGMCTKMATFLLKSIQSQGNIPRAKICDAWIKVRFLRL